MIRPLPVPELAARPVADESGVIAVAVDVLSAQKLTTQPPGPVTVGVVWVVRATVSLDAADAATGWAAAAPR